MTFSSRLREALSKATAGDPLVLGDRTYPRCACGGCPGSVFCPDESPPHDHSPLCTAQSDLANFLLNHAEAIAEVVEAAKVFADEDGSAHDDCDLEDCATKVLYAALARLEESK